MKLLVRIHSFLGHKIFTLSPLIRRFHLQKSFHGTSSLINKECSVLQPDPRD